MLFAVTAAAVPAPSGTGTSGPITQRRVASGWVTFWRFDDGVASVLHRPGLFRDVSMFWFRATRRSSVVEQSPGSQPAEAELIDAVDRIQAQGVRVYVAVNDQGLGAHPMAGLLGDPARTRDLVNSLVGTVKRIGADGVDIDFEAMNFGPAGDKARVRTRFPAFLARLHSRLAANGLLLSVAVPPRRGPADPGWAVFDYTAIARHVDRARVMTYDYHSRGTPPGPVAPLRWVNRVAGYAAMEFGRRLSLGLPAYGYTWFVRRLSGTCPADAAVTTSGTTRDMVAIAQREAVAPRYDPGSGGLTFDYVLRYSDGSTSCRVQRTVWYEDGQSVAAKLPVLDRYRIGSVALWQLGGERRGTWQVLKAFARR